MWGGVKLGTKPDERLEIRMSTTEAPSKRGKMIKNEAKRLRERLAVSPDGSDRTITSPLRSTYRGLLDSAGADWSAWRTAGFGNHDNAQ
jgi:hypothetical protein